MQTKYLTSGYARKHENKYIFLYDTGGRETCWTFAEKKSESFHVRRKLVRLLLVARVDLLYVQLLVPELCL
jgi:hypothetical protein